MKLLMILFVKFACNNHIGIFLVSNLLLKVCLDTVYFTETEKLLLKVL